MKRMNMKFLSILLASVLLLSGCAREIVQTQAGEVESAEKKFYPLKKDRVFNAAVDAFFEAVDARDADAIKALFSPNALEQAEDIDEEIEKLFAFYPGPTQRCERDGVGPESGSSDHGKRIRRGSDWFAVVCDGANYYCDFSMVFQNDMDRNEEGVWSIDLVSEKVICAEDFKFSTKPGLHAESEAPGAYQTRRIKHYPEVFVPIERELDREEIRAFLEKETDFGVFQDTFGESNAETIRNGAYAYELPDEEGEKRYLILYVTDEGKIRLAYIVNETDIKPLETLWEAKKDDAQQ
ncbi:MAG: DUF5104 domain-containing protein [Lachnospiraceae bacterium]|nr:DUF5104 domain-containing protein [Lachnospiraceae bacterium]